MSDSNVERPSKTKDELKLKYFNLLSRKLSSYQRSNEYCDVKIKVGSRVFNCHRCVLAANSKYFGAFFKANFKEGNDDMKCLPSECVDEKTFSKLLDSMYGKPFEINGDLVSLFVAGVYLQLDHFTDCCKQYITDNLDTIDIIELITLMPELKFDQSLYAAVKKHLCRNFLNVYSHLAGISLEVFEDLALDPELFVINRDQLLEFGKDWICYDIKNRKQHLPKVASSLKPFHTPSARSLDLVSKMDSLLQSEYYVNIALSTLLELPDTRNDKEEHKLDVTHPLFFVQPNNDSEVMLGTYRDSAWVFLNKFRLPISARSLSTYEGAVANNVFYFSAKYNQTDEFAEQTKVIYRGLNGEMKEWIELMPPRSMPKCLVTCNSMVYSYEDSFEDHQISVFEPLLNRWLRVPAVTYPRSLAGMTSDDFVLYMVGGIPLKKIAAESPTNIIEMFDSRCGNWSRISVPSTYAIPNEDYSNRVCFMDKTLYMINGKTGILGGVDTRNNKWTLNPVKPTSLQNVSAVDYLTTVNQTLWIIASDSKNGIKIVNGSDGAISSLPNPNVFVKPITSPSWM